MYSNPQQSPASAKPRAPHHRSRLQLPAPTFSGVFLGIVALWTVAAVWAAAADKGWLAMGMALIYGPAVNLLLAVFGASYLATRQTRKPCLAWKPEAMVIVIATLASALAILGATLTMELHGCC
ncbi:MAG TPA: hypothetical protein VHC19_04670 [Pirellulales bacterium]|jgi:hypothetical protein|nr:hypothetical protein [Pirellulales bacterium]